MSTDATIITADGGTATGELVEHNGHGLVTIIYDGTRLTGLTVEAEERRKANRESLIGFHTAARQARDNTATVPDA